MIYMFIFNYREIKDEPLPEEFSPVITCGTLIIRKEGTSTQKILEIFQKYNFTIVRY